MKITFRHVHYSLFIQYFSVFLNLRSKIPVKNGKEPGLNPTVLKRVLCRVTLIEGAAKFYLCLFKHFETMNIGEVKIQLNGFLTSKLQDCNVLIPGKEQPVHWIGGWLDTIAALAAVERTSPRLLSIQKLIPTDLSVSPYCLVINLADRCKNNVSSNVF